MVEKKKTDGLTRAYETLLYALTLDRLGLEPGADYDEHVRILANAQRANPALISKVEDAIAYASEMCTFGKASPHAAKRNYEMPEPSDSCLQGSDS